jgi:hypothetical protein
LGFLFRDLKDYPKGLVPRPDGNPLECPHHVSNVVRRLNADRVPSGTIENEGFVVREHPAHAFLPLC